MSSLSPPDEEAALSLALAVIVASDAPLLLLDDQLVVIAASMSFCRRAFRIDPAEVAGRQIFILGHGEWDAPRLRSLLTATLSGLAKVDSYEMDLTRIEQQTLRLVLKAERLIYSDFGQPRHASGDFGCHHRRATPKS